jgi:hypothetical protein
MLLNEGPHLLENSTQVGCLLLRFLQLLVKESLTFFHEPSQLLVVLLQQLYLFYVSFFFLPVMLSVFKDVNKRRTGSVTAISRDIFDSYLSLTCA